MNKIKIKKGVDYEIEISNLPDGDWGQCLSATKDEPGNISIRKGLSQKNTQRTLIHEVIHALDFEYNIDLTEKQVLLLEEAVVKLLHLNDIRRYIQIK